MAKDDEISIIRMAKKITPNNDIKNQSRITNMCDGETSTKRMCDGETSAKRMCDGETSAKRKEDNMAKMEKHQ